MPRFNICHNNKWICFSTIVDDFVTELMSIEEYEQWRTDEYGRNKTELQHANKMNINDALLTIKNVHGSDRYYEAIKEVVYN